MAYLKLRVLIACAAVLFACCQGEHRPEAPEQQAQTTSAHPGLHKLTIGETAVYVDIANNYASRKRGLKYRKELPEDVGMIFIYPEPGIRSFWMQDTYIPLSLAYIDENGRIFQFVDMKPRDETSHSSEAPAQYVLEVNQGWFGKHGIKTGDLVNNLPSPEGAE